MRRALRRAVGVFLASGAVSLPSLALAQTPVQRMPHEEHLTLTAGHSRLEEMKVQLALLADIATFPYNLGASAAGANLTVRGFVPNERVKQRALELARQHTFLRVSDGMRIQSNLSLRSPLRAADMLQREGAELLARNLGAAGRQMQVRAMPNSQIVVNGPVASVEEKVAVSQLFRQLSGCSGVVNELTVQPVLRDGQRVVAVTKDGSQLAAPSALGMKPEQKSPARMTSGPVPGTWKPAPPPTPAARSSILDAREGELSLPKIKNISSGDPKPATSAAPQPAANSNRAAMSWESQTPAPAPRIITVTPPATDDKPRPATPDETPKIKNIPASKSAPFAADRATPALGGGKVDALQVPPVPTGWQRPGTGKSSETPAKPTPPAPPVPSAPKAPPATAGAGVIGAAFQYETKPSPAPATPPAPVAAPTPPASAAAPKPRPLAAPIGRPVRRWPPAYEVIPAEPETGTLGTIEFEEEPAPSAAPAKTASSPPAPAAPRTTTQDLFRPIGTENLKKQIKSVCGRHVKDVRVEPQRDGTILVSVKVTRATEKQVMSKLLTIPDMLAPKVRLAMDVLP